MKRFVLQNEPPKHKPWKGEEAPKTKQQVLFSGMDCLSGQRDLFATDGEETEAETER